MALFRFGRKDKDEPRPEAAAVESAPAAPAAAAPSRPGFLDRLKSGLAKTAKVLSTDVRDIF
jgi:hypothetical protein